MLTKVLLEEADPFFVTAGRFLIGFVVLAPFAYSQGFRMRLAVEPTFVFFGLTSVVLYFGLQNLGLVFTSAGNAALIQAGVPPRRPFWRFSSCGSGYLCGDSQGSLSRWGA